MTDTTTGRQVYGAGLMNPVRPSIDYIAHYQRKFLAVIVGVNA